MIFLCIFLLVFFTPKPACSTSPFPENDIIDTTKMVFNWIESVCENGRFTKENTGQNQFDLYSGSSGVIIFLLEYYRTFKDPKALNLSKSIADDLIASYDSEIVPVFNPSFFHWGLCGLGFTFHVLSDYVNDTKYIKFAQKIDDIIVEYYPSKDMENTGVRWGSAGTGFYLIWKWEREGKPKNLLDIIVKGAELLEAKAHQVSSDKIKWLFGGKFPFVEMPNYGAGTAGISHFYLKMYEITNDDHYLNVVTKGINYVISLADTSDNGCLIEMDNLGVLEKAKYYFGECNGNSGTGKVWVHLYQHTKDPKWLDWAKRSAKNLIDVHKTYNWWIPKKSKEGYFWNNMGICDGSSAVLQFLWLLQSVHPDDIYVETINDIVENIMSRRIIQDEKYVYWEQAEWRTKPKEELNQVGYYQGAAGIASTMLHLIREEVRIKLPDYTFY